MLWSVLKILIFVLLVVAITFGVSFLMETDQLVLVTMFGREFALTPLSAAIAALLLLLAVWIVLRVAGLLVATFRFLNGDETALSRYWDRRSERKGYEAFADGMLALASGEGRLAIRKAERAEGYLNRPELTNLLVAQAAEMAGDRAKATETYKALVQRDATRFVGIRGLMRQKLEVGDTETALALAEKAFVLRPQHGEVQDTLLQLQAGSENWTGARATLAAKLKSGSLPRDVHKRRDAVLALAHARDALAAGQIEEARKDATEANRLSPDLVPAAVMAARMAIEEGKPRVATKVIRKAWDKAPHPDLAAAFAEIEPTESPEERLKRFRVLFSKHPDDPEVKLLKAELNIAAEDYAAARAALGDLAETAPTARSLTIMAAIERGQGAEDHHVRAWLAKAVTASRGPQWTCEACGHVHADWHPVCEHCDRFDTLAWIEAPQSNAALAATAPMLPLIVGALERPQSDAEEAEIVVIDPEEKDDEAATEADAPAPEAETEEDDRPSAPAAN
ncbi:heme biosynthesis protein HemY [Alterinioella nitratireducens]|uniref:heme biosynthesis protein HemY n=1 Tax=Alterinioella nitratireducens TaxID=2735915 RepID=UPI001552ECFC|nr:heme biosynthesis HemY N-terminal domain-containing protein [Alterinioella nitratireducens]NPD20148.1 heme biosynthesis protein HemY [Alterinioella nitratireducens]